MASNKKSVLVRLEEFNRVVEFEHYPDSKETERDCLLTAVRAAFSERIDPDHRLTLQVKDDDWGGVFVDCVGDEVPDRAIMKVLLEKRKVCIYMYFARFVCMHTLSLAHAITTIIVCGNPALLILNR